jgi:hypothetical protein
MDLGKVGASVTLEDSSPEDGGDLPIGLQDNLVKHALSSDVNDVSFSVNKVAPLVDGAAFAVDEATILVLLNNGAALLVQVKVALNSLDVELGEGENLRELAVLQVLTAPQLGSANVNDVALLVNEVASLVHSAAEVVRQARLGVFVDNASMGILVKLAHDVLNIETLARVIKQLGQVAIFSQLILVKLLASVHINEVPLAGKCHPSMFVDSSGLFVQEESLFRLHQLWLLILVFKVAHQLVRVEVKLLVAEHAGNLTMLVQVSKCEHLLAIHVLNNIVVLVNQVTLAVGLRSGLVLIISAVALGWPNSVAALVVVHVAEDIVHIESSKFSVWRHVNRLLLLELLLQGFGHRH